MLSAAIFLLIATYPLLHLIDKLTLYAIIPAILIFVIANEIFFGPSNLFFKNLFPVQFRYRGSSLSYCSGIALVGGLTPLIDNYLYHMTGCFSSIALWLMFITAGSIISIALVCRKKLVSIQNLMSEQSMPAEI